MKETISISDASRITGLSQKQIRTFEDRGYIIPPQRIQSGEISYRRFNLENIKNLKAMKSFIDLGFTLPVASRKAMEFMTEKEVDENGRPSK